MVRLHWIFEWDEVKAASNLTKHGITFEAAADALRDVDGDRFQIDRDDPGHADGEDRYITTASLPGDRSLVLIISWTDRSGDDERITRIISARKASRREVKDYVREIGG